MVDGRCQEELAGQGQGHQGELEMGALGTAWQENGTSATSWAPCELPGSVLRSLWLHSRVFSQTAAQSEPVKQPKDV